MDSLPVIISFERSIVSISTFFNPTHAKNFAYLETAAKVLELPLRRVHYIFRQRWAAFAFNSLIRILHGMPVLYQGLESIACEPSFNPLIKAEALGHHSTIKTVEFVLISHLMLDVTDKLKEASQRFQKSGGVIIGQGRHIEILVQNMENKAENDNRYLEQLIKNLECKKEVLSTSWNRCANWKIVENSAGVRWKQQVTQTGTPTRIITVTTELTPVKKNRNEKNTEKLNEIRTALTTAVVGQLKRYFPENEFYEALDTLHPSNFDLTRMVEENYELCKMETLANRFDLNAALVKSQSRAAFYAIQDRPDFAKLKLKPVRLFWHLILGDSGFELGAEFRKLIEMALTIPNSSADGESYSN